MRMDDASEISRPLRSPEHRRLRMRRHGRRAYIRSIYSLPTLATLGNAICGFAAIYVAGLVASNNRDHITQWLSDEQHRFVSSAYLIFMAMVFDALDGRLARFARHTTDFGGQLDSLADVISFGAAPAFLALQLFKFGTNHLTALPFFLTRLNWAIGALYMSCAAMRLARFNVSNEHGEQHHFSFLGLPSPGAAGAVAAVVLVQQAIAQQSLLGEQSLFSQHTFEIMSHVVLWVLPVVVLTSGLLMVSQIRYPHLVNRYLRGKKSIATVMVVLVLALAAVVSYTYVLAGGLLIYVYSGPGSLLLARLRRRSKRVPATPPATP